MELFRPFRCQHRLQPAGHRRFSCRLPCHHRVDIQNRLPPEELGTAEIAEKLGHEGLKFPVLDHAGNGLDIR